MINKEELSSVEYYRKSLEDIFKLMDTDKNGLSEEESRQRLDKFGENKLKEKKKRSLFDLIFSQINNPVVYLLTAAATVAFIFGDTAEGIAILVVIFINTIIGFWMEFQAQESMDALMKMDKITAMVCRDDKEKKIDANFLVPGDIILLEAGMVVPADSRVIQEQEISVDESPLTGESLDVKKNVEAIKEPAGITDRNNMVYKGTSVTGGTGKAIVIATGMETEIGNISAMVNNADEEQIPLDKKLQKLTKRLIWLTLGLAAGFFLAGWIVGKDWYSLFQTAIAWSIAAIPEGLPVVASIALARGMLKLTKKQVIVKRLSAVETLGETTVIFTDKTGTLTENKLSVNQLQFHNLDYSIKIKENEVEVEGLNKDQEDEFFENFLAISALCNNATLEGDTVSEGDPLEISLLQFFKKFNRKKFDEIRKLERVAEDPFDSVTKYMGTVSKRNGKYYVAAKGAAECILGLCQKIITEKGVQELTEDEKERWKKNNNDLSGKGLRVIAYAYREMDKAPDKEEEPETSFMNSLILLGLVGFLDPPKKNVPQAVDECLHAGIHVVMVTGDHPGTALNIGEKVHIVEEDAANVMKGSELDTREEKKITSTRVFSRVDPEQKLNLIDHFQNQGEIVAMTGDGVNDAPALKKADIGIAMGQRGTQVAQEVAEMVLKDDSFPSIVIAIKEGRIIFENIKKFIMYQLSYHLAEILIITSISFTLFTLPLLPLQLLFLNLLSDVFPALALGVGKGNPHVMNLPPKDPQEPIITKQNWLHLVYYGLVIAASIAGSFLYAKFVWGLSNEIANNVAFFSLALAQLLHVFNMRESNEGIFINQVTSNKHIWFALAICISILIAAYLIPGLRDILSFQQLNLKEWGLIAFASTLPLIIIQSVKVIRGSQQKRRQ